MEDARSAIRYVAEQVRSDGLASAALNYFDRGWVIVRVFLFIAVGTLGMFVALSPLPTFGSWLSGDKLGMAPASSKRSGVCLSSADASVKKLAVIRAHRHSLSAIVAVVLVGAFYWALVLLFARNMRRRLAVADPIKAILNLRERHWDLAERAALGTQFPVFDIDIWGNIRNRLPSSAHGDAYREVFVRSWWDFTGSQTCPMTEAFEAGLFLYWIRPSEVVCVPHPVLHIVDGQLRGVEWATGESYRYGPEYVWPDSELLE
jgi:hypothetical protein